MVGANPKSRWSDRVGWANSPGVAQQAGTHRGGSHRLRWIAIVSALVPLSFVLVQCGKAPNGGMLAANSQAAAGDSFDERFPAPQFKDRFPSDNEIKRASADISLKRTAPAAPAPYRLASLEPTVPYQRPVREDQTALVWMKSSAFPYFSNNPHTAAPCLNIST